MRTTTALTPTQVNVLKVLSKSPNGLTRKQLEEKVKAIVTVDIIGPVYADDLHKHPDSLYAQNYVSPVSDEDGLRWYITHEGRDAGEKMRTRKPSSAVVPGSVLDPVVIAFRPTRTYGIELYTDEDIREIKTKLGAEYSTVLIEELRQQIVNRRKMGKYKTVSTYPEWYIAYRQGRHWTALVDEMTEHSNCIINPTHSDGVNVYHRRFFKGGESVINQETPKDLIVLCESCRKKLSGNLPEIPAEMP